MEWYEIKMNEKHRNWINSCKTNTFNIFEGGVRSGKTTSLVLAFCRHLETLRRGGLHVAFAESIGVARIILLEGGDGLGIAGYFGKNAREGKYKGKDALFIKIRDINHVVIFVGSKNSDSYKAIRGLTVTSVIGTEISLAHESFMKEIVARTLMTSLKDRKYFLDLNPTLDTHYIYTKFIDRWIKESKDGTLLGGVNYMTCTLYENPAIDEEKARYIASQYDKTSNSYKSLILGQRVNYLDTVYTLYDYNMMPNEELLEPLQYIITMDVGISASATTFVCGGKARDGKYYIYDSYYHRNGSASVGAKVKEYEDYANDLVDFYRKQEKRFHRPARYVMIDKDITMYRMLLKVFQANGIPSTKIEYVIKEKIIPRIIQTRNLLYTGNIIIGEDLTLLQKAISNAVYDQKEKDRGKMVRLDDTSLPFNPIDLVDAFEYLISYFIKYN